MNLVPIFGPNEADEAVSRLASGGVVALPTETVYGLGAAINQPGAIARIFEIKGRPTNHPLIVHVSDWTMAEALIAKPVKEYVFALIKAFTPGPITFILPKSMIVSDAITGGQDSVGIRIPNHPITRSIIEKLGVGVAAPSANKFGGVSPTSAVHVYQDLKEILNPESDAIVDGGECEIGLESTIVDCRLESPRILRPGAITEDMIRGVVGTVQTGSVDIRVSGSLQKHYSPNARVWIIGSTDEISSETSSAGLIALEQIPTPPQTIRLAMPRDSKEFAHVLYSALRKADELELQNVFIIAPSDSGIAEAIQDRITRAAN